MKLNQARKIIIKAIKEQIPVMLRGGPGIGKSDINKQLADELNLNIIDVRLAQLDPTDLRGIPVPNRETHRTEWYFPSFLPKVGEDGKCVDGPGVLFLDEIDKAPPSVKNAALQLVLDRCLGEYVLPDDWAIICAGNREEDNCFSSPLGTALSNRMTHIEVEPDPEIWAKWAHTNDIEEDIIAFVHFKPELLYKMTDHDAFPSPRSWEMASRLIKGEKDEATRKILLSSAVGEPTQLEFTAWSTVYRNVDPLKILKGELPEFNKKEQSFKYAVVMAVAFYARKKGIKNYMDGIQKFLAVMPPELRVVFFKQQTRQSLTAFANDKNYKNIIKDIMDAFDV